MTKLWEWLSGGFRWRLENYGRLRKPYPPPLFCKTWYNLCRFLICASKSFQRSFSSYCKNWIKYILVFDRPSLLVRICFIGNRMREDIRNLMLEISSCLNPFQYFSSLDSLHIFLDFLINFIESRNPRNLRISGFLETLAQTKICFRSGVHFSFDVLPSWADQGSCAHKCVC